MYKYIKYLLIGFDTLFTCFLIPFLLLITRFKRTKNKEKVVLFIGLEHVINKTAERAIHFEKHGFRCLFLSLEIDGHRCKEDFYKPSVIVYSRSIVKDTLRFFKILIKENPTYIEVYLEGNLLRQLFSISIAKASKIITITIERGTLSGFVFNTYKASFLLKILLLFIFRLSHFIFYKEYYMLEWFTKHRINIRKLFFDHNRVTIKEEPVYLKKDKNVLFLNGFWKYRRIELLIESIPLVLKEISDAKFILVGARNEEERKEVEQLVEKTNVGSCTTIYDWNDSPESFYTNASLFVLPANIVFCNYSLLEAMERGVPSIVANVRDADKIIDQGVDGFLSNQDSKDIANYIIQLLSNEELRMNMGMMARKKIIRNFNSEKRIHPILERITNFYKN